MKKQTAERTTSPTGAVARTLSPNELGAVHGGKHDVGGDGGGGKKKSGWGDTFRDLGRSIAKDLKKITVIDVVHAIDKSFSNSGPLD